MIDRKVKILFTVILLSVCQAAVSGSWKVDTPTEIPGGEVISIDEAKTLVNSKAAVFIDTRNPFNFAKGHIPGAVLIAYAQKSKPVIDFDASKDQFDLSHLPSSKNKTIVFYSHGTTGWKSYKAASLAIKAGYENIKWFRGGLEAWRSSGNSIEK